MAKLLRLLITTLAVLVALQADTLWRVWRLRLTNRCPNCTLVGVTLKGLDLRQANLKNADLRWAKLEAVRLDGADLRGANLRYARMDGVTTKNTRFCGAVMMNAVKGYCPSLGENLTGIDGTHPPAHLSQRSQTR